MYKQAQYDEKLIFEIESERTLHFRDEGEVIDIPEVLKREKLSLPEHSETDVIRHYTRLSQMNYGIDLGIYPLGSCTMKYNPKYAEDIAHSEKVQFVHPLQDYRTVQGSLQIMFELQEYLKALGGMDEVSLQPAAGAQGEFTGLSIIRAYHQTNGELEKRKELILPDSAHGTNPASATMAGFEVVEIKSNDQGMIDLEALKSVVSKNTAGLMITNPNTLGIFEEHILEIADILHSVGALLYYDGANLNAIMGKTTPGNMGFDIVHFNLHKTFSTPHGGGGPGAGPVGVKKHIADFLPVPIIRFDGMYYYPDYSLKNSIGKVQPYYGNFGILVRAWAYIRQQGAEGLTRVTERAVLNANYLKEQLKQYFDIPYKALRKHEFVVSAKNLRQYNVRAMDVAKRLLDYGTHAPTVYFPLIVDEALMIEPTETETKESLDHYAEVIKTIIKEAKEQPQLLKSAPHNTAIKRVNEVMANKNLILTWRMYNLIHTR